MLRRAQFHTATRHSDIWSARIVCTRPARGQCFQRREPARCGTPFPSVRIKARPHYEQDLFVRRLGADSQLQRLLLVPQATASSERSMRPRAIRPRHAMCARHVLRPVRVAGRHLRHARVRRLLAAIATISCVRRQALEQSRGAAAFGVGRLFAVIGGPLNIAEGHVDLLLDHRAVLAAFGHQLGVRSRLANAAALDDDD